MDENEKNVKETEAGNATIIEEAQPEPQKEGKKEKKEPEKEKKPPIVINNEGDTPKRRVWPFFVIIALLLSVIALLVWFIVSGLTSGDSNADTSKSQSADKTESSEIVSSSESSLYDDESNVSDDEGENAETPETDVVTKALALIEEGDTEAAYKLLYGAGIENENAQALLEKFLVLPQKTVVYDGSGETISTITVKYDSLGREINELKITPDGAYYEQQERRYDENGNVIYEFAFEQFPDELDGSIHISEYDENGNQIIHTSFRYDNDPPSNESALPYYLPVEQILYTYDAGGRLIERWKPYSYNHPTDPEVGKTVYVYHPNGNLQSETTEWKDAIIAQKQYNENGDLLFSRDKSGIYGSERVIENTYDSDGNLIYHIDKSALDEIIYTDKYTYSNGVLTSLQHTEQNFQRESSYVETYDSDGNVVERTSIQEDGTTVVAKYFYNSLGKVSKITTDYQDGTSSVSEYSYDQRGECIKYVVTISDGRVQGSETVFDANGNVLKEIDLSDNSISREYWYDDYGICVKTYRNFPHNNSSYTYVYSDFVFIYVP